MGTATLASVTLIALAAQAYVPSTTTKSGKPLRWINSNCVYIRVNANGSDDIHDGTAIEAAKKSLENWRSATRNCSYIKFVVDPENLTALPGYDKESNNNENIIYWQEKTWPHEPEAAALTTVTFVDKAGISSDGQILDSDIEMNGVNFHFATSGAKSQTDVENTLTHELGHLLGLDHPCDDGSRSPVPVDHTGATIPKCDPVSKLSLAIKQSTMFNFTDPGDTEKRTPEADDILGICDTYPKEQDPGVCSRPVLTADPGGCLVGSTGQPATLPLGFLLVFCGLLLILIRRNQSL
jgi:hypothetical protein